jgi:SAM-dependent methyltransferase
MPRDGELTYYQAIGDEGRRYALEKPFSENTRGLQLMQVGAIIDLLPPPPARVLECGCGTGWLAQLLQKCGYQVVGADVSPFAIELARANRVFHEMEPPQFVVADSEKLPFIGEFDAVVFFDSLHHSVDEQATVSAAYRALKPGGVLIASETGPGHHEKSLEVESQFDVTEKDMPPRRIIRLGRAAKFKRWRVYPRTDEVGKYLFGRHVTGGWLKRQLLVPPLNWFVALAMCTFLRGSYGITVMWK